jgi:biotin transporter BioY
MAVLGGSAYLGSRRGLAAMLLYVGMGLFLPFYAGGEQGWSQATGASGGTSSASSRPDTWSAGCER